MPGSRRIGGGRRSPGAARGAASGPAGAPAFDRQGAVRRQRRVEAQEPLAALGIVLAVDPRTGRGTRPSGAPRRRRAPGGPRRSRRPGGRSGAPEPVAGRRHVPEEQAVDGARVPGERRLGRASSTARRSGRSGPAGPSSDPIGPRLDPAAATGTPWGMPSAGGSTIRRAVGIALTGRLSTSAPASSRPRGGPSAEAQQVIPGPGERDRRHVPPGLHGDRHRLAVRSWPRCPGPTTPASRQANGPRPARGQLDLGLHQDRPARSAGRRGGPPTPP